MKKYMNMQSHQLDRMNKEIELRHNRAANLSIRNKWMEGKVMRNYQSEYDRIRTHMDQNSGLPWVFRDKLNNRKGALEKLGAQAFDGMRSK